jgi:hypothetical protein
MQDRKQHMVDQTNMVVKLWSWIAVSLFLSAGISGCIRPTEEDHAFAYLESQLPDQNLPFRIHIALAAAMQGKDLASWPDSRNSILEDLEEPAQIGDAIRLLYALNLAGVDAEEISRETLQRRVVRADGNGQFPYDGSVFTNALVVTVLLTGESFKSSDQEVSASTSFLIDSQLDDGGWGTAATSDIDTTAVVLRALAHAGLLTGGIRNDALQFLEDTQTSDGSYTFMGTKNCQSSGLAILGWASIQSSGPAALTDYVISCQNPDGGFAHVKGGESDLWATVEILQALSALR